jgi:hypothetical protein
MLGRQSPGDFIPGFDCSTGEALNRSHSEWALLIQGCRVEQHLDFQLVFHPDNGILLYEIYFVGHLTP